MSFSFSLFQSSEQTPRTKNNRREILVVKMWIFFSENQMFGLWWTEVLGVAQFSCFPLLLFQSFPVDVSSAVGATWGCVDLMT